MSNNTLYWFARVLNNPPEIVEHNFQLGNLQGTIGTIFKRKCYKLYWHYALFYGFDIHGTAWYLELNQVGIRFVTEQEFLQGEKLELDIINSNPNFKDIMLRRAKEVSHLIYHKDHFNCESFVNYCWFAELKSQQSDNTKIAATLVSNIARAYCLFNSKGKMDSVNKIFDSIDHIIEDRQGQSNYTNAVNRNFFTRYKDQL